MDEDVDVESIIKAIYIAKQFADRSKGSYLFQPGNYYDQLHEELYWELSNEAMLDVFADSRAYYNEDKDVNTFVFSDPSMFEYFCLCREYGQKHALAEEHNPFIKEAKSAIADAMSFHSYDYDYIIRTKMHKPRGCVLVLLTGYEFYCEYEVVEGLFELLDFFEGGISRLKQALEQPPEISDARIMLGTLKEAA